ncbi:hypothetical protein TanjilG_13799 [Lupinus angustifolius]|uniref:Uncharacterized protein n=1 Tax=Lupinus angustifolius TaxID=3871 RepID=A0A1J7G1J6_LUPAN|nr:hypothetical protein TanjilG_13799 [Lupinus angustifolius]
MSVAWLSHPSFEDQIRCSWSPLLNWNDNISNLQMKLRIWNKEVLGNIIARKKVLLRRLNGITRKLAHGSNDFLEQWVEYDTDLREEELFWF